MIFLYEMVVAGGFSILYDHCSFNKIVDNFPLKIMLAADDVSEFPTFSEACNNIM